MATMTNPGHSKDGWIRWEVASLCICVFGRGGRLSNTKQIPDEEGRGRKGGRRKKRRRWKKLPSRHCQEASAAHGGAAGRPGVTILTWH